MDTCIGKSADTKDFSFMYIKGNMLAFSFNCQISDFQYHFILILLFLVITVIVTGYLTTDHLTFQFIHGKLFGTFALYNGTISKDCDLIADFYHFLQVMGNHQNGSSLRFELLDKSIQYLAVILG